MGLIALVSSVAFRPWVSNETAQGVLVSTHFASPLIILVVFLVAFITHSVITAPRTAITQDATPQTGPGGKPLPKKTRSCKDNLGLDFNPTRKKLFIGLSVGSILTFVASAALIIIHALWDREENWWCGQAAVVHPFPRGFVLTCRIANLDWPRSTSLHHSSSIPYS